MIEKKEEAPRQASTVTGPRQRYEPPRITAKLRLDKVTLFTGGGTGPGGPPGHIGDD